MGVKFNVADLGKTGLLDPEQLGYQDSMEIIKDETLKMQKSFVKIGWYLKHIRDRELFKEDGYANIYECASDRLGYSQSTTSRFINICEKFSKNHNSPELDDRYAGFDKSQMIEMLPLAPDQLEKVTPDMTVQQIRNIKDSARKESDAVDRESEGVEDIPGQTSIETDFPEYMPKPTALRQAAEPVRNKEEPKPPYNQEPLMEEYATSHSDVTEESSDTDAGECQDGSEHDELPSFHNNDQRKEWLSNYKAWGLWYRDENIDVNYYKFDFTDGRRLIVEEYPQRHVGFPVSSRCIPFSDEVFYHLLEFDKKYCHAADSRTYLVDFLRNLQNSKS